MKLPPVNVVHYVELDYLIGETFEFAPNIYNLTIYVFMFKEFTPVIVN